MSIITNRTAMGTMNVMFQNGVGDGAGLPSPQIQMGSSVNGSVGDSPKRPSKLSVVTPKVRLTKEDSEDMQDGSLPCTPETHSVDGLDVSGRPAGDEAAVDSDTRQLLSRFMADVAGVSRAQWRESRELATMKRVVGDLIEKHRYVYNGRRPGFVWRRRYKGAALGRGEPREGGRYERLPSRLASRPALVTNG